MTMKQQERVKLFLFLSAWGTSLALSSHLLESSDTMESTKQFLNLLMDVSILGTGWFESMTEDYKEIKWRYEEVVKNSASLLEELELADDPVNVFAAYIYLYRKGYLSYQHQFTYDFKMKDFSRLQGVDLVLGSGVCRSISSMFVDLCKTIGMDANNVLVNAKDQTFQVSDTLTSVSLESSDNRSKFAKVISKTLEHFPLNNHAISQVFVEGVEAPRYFDPTNVVTFSKGAGNKLEVDGISNSYVRFHLITSQIPRFLGQMKVVRTIPKASSVSSPYCEVVSTYHNALKRVEENVDVLENFYMQNQPLYESIYQLSMQQHAYIKRCFPILPIRSY